MQDATDMAINKTGILWSVHCSGQRYQKDISGLW